MAVLAQMTGSGFHFHYSVDPAAADSDEYVLHGHSAYEVYFLVGGRVHYLIEGRRYDLKPGSLLLMRPGVLHGYKVFAGQPYERYALHFYEDALMPEYAQRLLAPFSAEAYDEGCHLSGELLPGFSSLFEALVLCSQMEGDEAFTAAEFAVHSLLMHIAYISRRRERAAPVSTATGTISEILRYLNENYTRHIALDELSAAYYINKNYLNRVFREVTGTTVMEYVLRKRIVLAQQLMRRGVPAAEAGQRAGFGDYSTFYRAYRRFNGSSPGRDRTRALLDGKSRS